MPDCGRGTIRLHGGADSFLLLGVTPEATPPFLCASGPSFGARTLRAYPGHRCLPSRLLAVAKALLLGVKSLNLGAWSTRGDRAAAMDGWFRYLPRGK